MLIYNDLQNIKRTNIAYFKGPFCSGDLQHFAEIVLLYSFASFGVYIDRMDMIAVICKRHKYT